MKEVGMTSTDDDFADIGEMGLKTSAGITVNRVIKDMLKCDVSMLNGFSRVPARSNYSNARIVITFSAKNAEQLHTPSYSPHQFTNYLCQLCVANL